MKVQVQCTVVVEVEYEDDCCDVFFEVEENGCPATGKVGSVIDNIYEKAELYNHCWACSLRGKNEIIAINEIPIDEYTRKTHDIRKYLSS